MLAIWRVSHDPRAAKTSGVDAEQRISMENSLANYTLNVLRCHCKSTETIIIVIGNLVLFEQYNRY